MATESETLQHSGRFRLSALKGKLFEAILVVATLVGLVALVMLFGFMFVDAVSPGSASAEWYLLFFATLVGPVSAFTLYSRRHPAVRSANARASAAVFGGLALSLAAFVVLRAMSPYGPLTYVVTVGSLPLSVAVYGRYAEETYFIGPAMVLATLLAVVWTLGSEVLLTPLLDGIFELGVQLLGGVPVLGSVPVPVDRGLTVTAIAVGVPTLVAANSLLRRQRSLDRLLVVTAVLALSAAGTTGLDGLLRPYLETLSAWVAYGGVVGTPVVGTLALVVTRRRNVRSGLVAAGAAVAGSLLVAVVALTVSVNPRLLVVLALGVGVPTVYVVGRTVLTDRDGRVGVAGPFIIIGGILLGAYIDQSLSVTGPDTWVTPTLLVESWDGLFPTEAGAYPSTVGSIMIVGLMALMAFPIGTGAAIYLEEYAPDSGWQGKLAGVIELNIANLAGVPSVVYGLLGLALFQNFLDYAPGLVFSASVTLGFLILPIVIVSAQEALKSVPDSLREASYGMGASRWQTVRSVVLPEAVPGI
ncbi:MAG: ABC-type phosphate transport system, permease component [halophilic archaeon J07HX64]|jgi:ABC-type phosphate transport system, permease component|nr:MAG: ABC-type phosphate transport system, permease component [halophilic archaeon J07HX64]